MGRLSDAGSSSTMPRDLRSLLSFTTPFEHQRSPSTSLHLLSSSLSTPTLVQYPLRPTPLGAPPVDPRPSVQLARHQLWHFWDEPAACTCGHALTHARTLLCGAGALHLCHLFPPLAGLCLHVPHRRNWRLWILNLGLQRNKSSLTLLEFRLHLVTVLDSCLQIQLCLRETLLSATDELLARLQPVFRWSACCLSPSSRQRHLQCFSCNHVGFVQNGEGPLRSDERGFGARLHLLWGLAWTTKISSKRIWTPLPPGQENWASVCVGDCQAYTETARHMMPREASAPTGDVDPSTSEPIRMGASNCCHWRLPICATCCHERRACPKLILRLHRSKKKQANAHKQRRLEPKWLEPNMATGVRCKFVSVRMQLCDWTFSLEFRWLVGGS